ncbi:MAG TPA: hypothetical protein VMM36_05520 [Opitutaceae bacterium]|nr:hypothetical protein [Opitutaceae bacterium]
MTGSTDIRISNKVLLKDCLLISAMIGVCAIHQYAVIAVLVVLTVLALRSTLFAVQALSILFLLIYINPVIQLQSPQLLMFRWAVFFAACGRIFLSVLVRGGNVHEVQPIRYLHIFCSLALITNFIANPTSPVGYLKLFAFAFGVTAIFAGAAFNTVSRDRLFIWLLAMCVVIFGLSIPFLAIPAGYFSKMRQLEIAEAGDYVEVSAEWLGGFMGILGHAQSFGTVAALLCTFLFVTIFFSKYQVRWIAVATFMVGLVMLYLSKARTGGLAFMIAVTAVTLLAVFGGSARRRVHRTISHRALPAIVLGGLVVLAGLLVGGGVITKGMRTFIEKGDESQQGILDAYMGSRGGLIELSMANFRAHPIFGIGFGRNSWEAQGYANPFADKGLLSLTFSPTEKGQIATAVLEETGIIGALAFLTMIGSFILFFAREANVYGLGLFVCVLALNMGEMNLFAMGGLGMLEWLFIAFGGMLADRCTDPVVQPGRPPR